MDVTAQRGALDGISLHRPARTWPTSSEGDPINLAAPPAPPEEGSIGRWTTLLPAVGSLSMIAFVFIVRSLVYLIVIGFMVVAMVGAGLGTTLAQTRSGRRRWNTIRERYQRHLDAVEEEATLAAELQRAGLDGTYPDTNTILALCRAGDGIWERRPAHPDFGSVRVGLGQVPAARPVAVRDTDGPLVEPDPELAERADAVVKEGATLAGAPVIIPLARLGTVAVIGDAPRGRDLVGAWLASLAAFHAPGELRILGSVPAAAERDWDWTKWLPHTRDPGAGDGFGRARRAVTTDEAAFAEQVELLARPRVERWQRSAEVGGSVVVERPMDEHAVVVVDGYTPGGSVAQTRELDTLMAHGAALGVTVVVLVASSNDVPAACGARVELQSDGTAWYLEAGPGGRVDTGIVPDRVDRATALALARQLAPLRLASGELGSGGTDSIRLVELLGLEDVAQLDPGREWLSVGPGFRDDDLLRAPIGRSDEGEVVSLDLKEAAAGGMGPHGILVGATGSGKSELLRSFTAGLAARHDPELLNLLLVDFKGGAAFAELGALPHTAGLVTNLADDLPLVERVQQALSGELDRRQEALREAGNLDSIRDYHAALAAGAHLPPLPYLVVVVDEFGELLAARPEFIDTFNAVGRLGRSLGMHLLLATQRLDEGRIRGLEPHLRYRLCLRTYTAAESRAVVGSSAAFELPALPGLGYLRVDAALVAFKAGLVTLSYRPAETTGTGRPGSVLIRPLSLSRSALPEQMTAHEPGRTDLGVLVELLSQTGTARCRQVWLDPLPDGLTLGSLLDSVASHRGGAPAVALGVVDLPERQARQLLLYDMAGPGGNLGIVGAPRSGKSTLLQSLVLSLVHERTPDEIQLYGLDLGGGGLFALAGLRHLGAVVGRGEAESTARLLRELRALVDERAIALRRTSSANGGQRAWPRVFLLIDGVGLLRTTLPDAELAVAELATAGLQYGVHVVVTSNRWFDIRPQLLDALGTRLELHLGDALDSGVSRSAARRVPAGRPGRGITRDGHLFQGALPSFAPDTATGSEEASLADAVEELGRNCGPGRAPAITTLPERVGVGEVAGLAQAAGSSPPEPGGGFLLAVSELRCRPVQVDLVSPGSHLLVYGEAGSGRTTLLARALRWLCASCPAERLRVHLVDPARGLAELADQAHVDGYAATATAAEKLALDLAAGLSSRLPPDELTPAQLRAGSWWSGPDHVLVVDDYDLLIGTMGGPLTALVDLLGHAGDVGLHVLLARRVAGSQRTAFEAFGQRLRETGATGLVLSGSPDEGPILAGIAARILPPGRGHLVSRHASPLLVQCCLDDPAAELDGAEPAREAGPRTEPAREAGPRTEPARDAGATTQESARW